MINGKVHAWEDIQIYIREVAVAGIREINYREGREAEAIYGTGSKPLGVGLGNYSVEGDFTLTEAEANNFERIARAAGKDVFDYAPFDIKVAYADKKIEGDFIGAEWNPLHVDVIKNVVITRREQRKAQNDKVLEVRYEFIAQEVVRGTTPVAA